MILFNLVFCYIGGRSYIYYSLSFAPFACLGFIPIARLLEVLNRGDFLRKYMRVGYFILATVAALAAFVLTGNRYMMLADREDLPQYKFAHVITQSPDATLLNYGFLDGGFYTTTGIIPNCRAFCKLNIQLDELRDLQDSFVRDGMCEFVVTRDLELNSVVDAEKYTLIDTAQYPFEGAVRTYYLYHLNSTT